MPDTKTVKARIFLPENVVPAVAGKVLVQVEDVTRADAPSRIVAESVDRDVHIEKGSVLPFELEIPRGAIEDRNSYSVRVHVDMSGSGSVDVGDLISTQSYPVLTRGFGNEVAVRLQRV